MNETLVALALARQFGLGPVVTHERRTIRLDPKPADVMIDGRRPVGHTHFGPANGSHGG
jgi:hypothetical protein